MRFPRLPVGGYVPPASHAPRGGSGGGSGGAVQSADREAAQRVFTMLELGSAGMSVASEKDVYQTAAPRRSLDVFVSTSELDPSINAALSVFVYAINSGLRSLVATGRVVLRSLAVATSTPGFDAPAWVVSVRGVQADQFQVSTSVDTDDATALPDALVRFSISASDSDAPPAPGEVGLASFGALMGGTGVEPELGNVSATGFTCAKLELVSLHAICGAASARAIHLHDLNASGLGAAVAGQTPVMAWPIGAAVGDGITVDRIHYRSRKSLVLVASSTMGTTTRVVDCFISATVR